MTGEFGFAEAYERKKAEIVDWLEDRDEKVRAFAHQYIDHLNKMIVAETKRAEESIALRKNAYGE